MCSVSRFRQGAGPTFATRNPTDGALTQIATPERQVPMKVLMGGIGQPALVAFGSVVDLDASSTTDSQPNHPESVLLHVQY